MISEIVTFGLGIGMGAIPSIATYIMCKREVYADWVLSGMLEEQQPKMVDGGRLYPSNQPMLDMSTKKVDIHSLAKAIIHNAQANANDWEIIHENHGVRVGGRTMFGVRNTKASISVMRNELTFSMADDIWLNNVKIKESVFKGIVKGVTEVKDNAVMVEMLSKLNPPALPSHVIKRLTDESNVKQLSDYSLGKKKKEASSKDLVDPFCEYTKDWNDHIHTIGMAKAQFDRLAVRK